MRKAREMKPLDARLACVAELTREALQGKPAPRAADVGCDHGRLTLHLLRGVPGLTMYSSDVSAPSLQKARDLLAEYGMEDRARLSVADGLAALDEPVDAVVIAGMGAGTALRILREGRARVGDAALIVQANRDVEFLRAGLAEMGFAVEREAYCEAAGRRYVALRARSAPPRRLTAREAFLGAAAGSARDEEQRAYWNWRRDVIARQMARAASGRSPSAAACLARRNTELTWIEEALHMGACTAKEIERLVGEIAPYELAEEWDNVGLLVGRGEREVTRVLVALDATQAALDEAVALGAQLIVTHHPVMFHARKRLTDGDREGALLLAMARADVALIAAHTNLDAAPGGVNDTLMRLMGCEAIEGEGCVRAGVLPEETTLDELRERAARALGGVVRAYGPGGARVRRLGCCSGAGGSELDAARMLGIDCFLTGEIAHHAALDAVGAGLCVLEAGHYETENPVCDVLKTALQTKLDALKYTVTVFRSGVDPFGREE